MIAGDCAHERTQLAQQESARTGQRTLHAQFLRRNLLAVPKKVCKEFSRVFIARFSPSLKASIMALTQKLYCDPLLQWSCIFDDNIDIMAVIERETLSPSMHQCASSTSFEFVGYTFSNNGGTALYHTFTNRSSAAFILLSTRSSRTTTATY